MQKVSHNYKITIISLSSPLLIGLYLDDILIKSLSSNKKTSEGLLDIVKDLIDKYEIKEIIYANGPGSYMAIKLTYIMLETINIIKDIPIKASSAFEFNDNKPIKAMGNLYFIKEKETIITQKFTEAVNMEYTLPKSIKDLKLEESNQPDYRLPAV